MVVPVLFRNPTWPGRQNFAKLIWQIASPQWAFDEATFDPSAASFDNPDRVGIVIHNYRWRLGLLKATRDMTTSNGGSPNFPSSPCLPSPRRVMPTARHIRIRAQFATGSPRGLCLGYRRVRRLLVGYRGSPLTNVRYLEGNRPREGHDWRQFFRFSNR